MAIRVPNDHCCREQRDIATLLITKDDLTDLVRPRLVGATVFQTRSPIGRNNRIGLVRKFFSLSMFLFTFFFFFFPFSSFIQFHRYLLQETCTIEQSRRTWLVDAWNPRFYILTPLFRLNVSSRVEMSNACTRLYREGGGKSIHLSVD